MIISWWWLWIVFIIVFAISPIGYGWGYRGWGPPYPRYLQRRRGSRAAGSGQPVLMDHYAWGWGGDFVWLMVIIALCWFLAAFWWR
jgi:hypothetical protein